MKHCSSYQSGDQGGSHGMYARHGARPAWDAAHEGKESAAEEREEHRSGKEPSDAFRGGRKRHGMKPISDKAHEATETKAQEREEHRSGKEAKHMLNGGTAAGVSHVPMPMHGARGGRGGSRRTKATPGMYYTDGMVGGMCHNYTGADGMAGSCDNRHEFKGGMKGKTPFLKKLMSKKGK